MISLIAAAQLSDMLHGRRTQVLGTNNNTSRPISLFLFYTVYLTPLQLLPN
jgi:hypothetical protein